MTAEKQINGIMKNFDFKKVRKIMTVLDWSWSGSNEPPTVSEMETMARGLFKSLQERDDCKYCASGGFKASRRSNEFDHKYFELEFIVEETSGEFIHE